MVYIHYTLSLKAHELQNLISVLTAMAFGWILTALELWLFFLCKVALIWSIKLLEFNVIQM